MNAGNDEETNGTNSDRPLPLVTIGLTMVPSANNNNVQKQIINTKTDEHEARSCLRTDVADTNSSLDNLSRWSYQLHASRMSRNYSSKCWRQHTQLWRKANEPYQEHCCEGDMQRYIGWTFSKCRRWTAKLSLDMLPTLKAKAVLSQFKVTHTDINRQTHQLSYIDDMVAQ